MNELELVRILLDESVDLESRDDAAMDLGSASSPEAYEALVKVLTDAKYDILVSSAAESIAEHWIRGNKIDRVVYDSLHGLAKHEVDELIESKKPELLKF